MKGEVLLTCSKEVAIDPEPEELIFYFLKFRLDILHVPTPNSTKVWRILFIIINFYAHFSSLTWLLYTSNIHFS